MKRVIGSVTVLLALASGLAAQVGPGNLLPKDAKTMGMGGAFSALSSGYQSLFGNPAGFGAPKASLTIMDATAWLYMKPTMENFAKLESVIADPSAAIGVASELITDNGIGGGASLGLGYVGKGLGLGFYLVNEEYARGNTLLGTSLDSLTQANLVLGMAVPIGTKDVNLTLGGDVRPSFLLSGSWPASDILTAFFGGGDPMTTLRTQNVLSGFNVFLDLGASLKLGSLGIGLAVRDIAPTVAFAPTTLGEVIDGLGGELPKAVAGDPKTDFFPNISAGISWAPRLIPGLFEPSLYFEVRDPVRAIREKAELWNLLHVGGELKLLSFAYLRAGLNRGWLSAGIGLDLLILEVNAAVFTEELGRRPGDQGRSGIALQAALRL